MQEKEDVRVLEAFTLFQFLLQQLIPQDNAGQGEGHLHLDTWFPEVTSQSGFIKGTFYCADIDKGCSNGKTPYNPWIPVLSLACREWHLQLLQEHPLRF